MKNLQQGDLDGLCGVYAVINALRIILVAKKIDTENEEIEELLWKLMLRICRKFGNELTNAMYYGVNDRDIEIKIIDTVISFARLKWSVVLAKKKYDKTNLDRFWGELEMVNKNGPADSIIRIREGGDDEEDHWTAVERANKNSLALVDSGERKSLKRSRCVLGKAQQGSVRIYPGRSWLLHVRN